MATVTIAAGLNSTRFDMILIHRRTRLLVPIVSVLFLPVFSTAQVAWVKSFEAALKQAQAEKKLIYLDISASW